MEWLLLGLDYGSKTGNRIVVIVNASGIEAGYCVISVVGRLRPLIVL